MKQHIRQLVFKAIEALQEDGQLDADMAPEIQIERTRDASHGEYACNVAMMLAKQARCNPRALAEKIVNAVFMSVVEYVSTTIGVIYLGTLVG